MAVQTSFSTKLQKHLEPPSPCRRRWLEQSALRGPQSEFAQAGAQLLEPDEGAALLKRPFQTLTLTTESSTANTQKPCH
jgi:hypothetical protein